MLCSCILAGTLTTKRPYYNQFKPDEIVSLRRVLTRTFTTDLPDFPWAFTKMLVKQRESQPHLSDTMPFCFSYKA